MTADRTPSPGVEVAPAAPSEGTQPSETTDSGVSTPGSSAASVPDFGAACGSESTEPHERAEAARAEGRPDSSSAGQDRGHGARTSDGVERGLAARSSVHAPDASAAHTAPRDRRYELKSRLRPIMTGLRDLEDYCRLDLGDALLADRVRGIHESLTDDVIQGVSYRLSDRWRAKLWDRYCLLRRHDPNTGAGTRFRYLRSLSGRRVRDAAV